MEIRGNPFVRRTAQPGTFRRSHLVFAIALFSSLALHVALIGIRAAPVDHGESAASPIAATVVEAWNMRLLNSTTSAVAMVNSERDSSRNELAPPVISTSNIQEPEYTHEPSRSDIRFYLFDEVETPAIPVEDWISPRNDSESTKGLQSAIIRIWILKTGEVQDVSILRTVPTNFSNDQKTALIDVIKKNLTRPAFRGGEPVASERTIEMVFDTGLENEARAPTSGFLKF
jgi:hypothetical protein